jgi:hypothetical protein
VKAIDAAARLQSIEERQCGAEVLDGLLSTSKAGERAAKADASLGVLRLECDDDPKTSDALGAITDGVTQVSEAFEDVRNRRTWNILWGRRECAFVQVEGLAVLAPIPREPRLVEQGIEYLGRWFMRPAQAGRWTSASGVRRDFTSVRRTYHTLHVSCSCQRSSDFHNPIYSKSLAICGCKPEFPIKKTPAPKSTIPWPHKEAKIR